MTLIFPEKIFYGLFMVISGGQCGADQGALVAAHEEGVETGGFAPKGWRTCRGTQPQLAKYGLVEAVEANYMHRTRLNVHAAHGTVVIATNPTSTGSRNTVSLARKAKKPALTIHTREDSTTEALDELGHRLADWIIRENVLTLNVAGNRDHYGSNLHHYHAHRIISRALQDLRIQGHLVESELQLEHEHPIRQPR